MTIERVTYPADLASWDPDQQPIYLELFGETSPTINTAYAEVLAANGPPDADATLSASAPVYEYWWTIGHTGGTPLDYPEWKNLFGKVHRRDRWTELPEHDAAHVFMSFPLGHGWRIKELTATLKYLAPAHDQRTILKESAQVWKAIAPLLGAAGGIAAGLPGALRTGEEIAASAPNVTPLHTAGGILDTLGKLSLNSVPAGETFQWSAAKMTWVSQAQPVQGILFQLPRKVFTDLGGRITGGISVSFIPEQVQVGSTVAQHPPQPSPGVVGCRCVLKSKTALHAPVKPDHEIELTIEPRLPAPSPDHTGGSVTTQTVS